MKTEDVVTKNTPSEDTQMENHTTQSSNPNTSDVDKTKKTIKLETTNNTQTVDHSNGSSTVKTDDVLIKRSSEEETRLESHTAGSSDMEDNNEMQNAKELKTTEHLQTSDQCAGSSEVKTDDVVMKEGAQVEKQTAESSNVNFSRKEDDSITQATKKRKISEESLTGDQCPGSSNLKDDVVSTEEGKVQDTIKEEGKEGKEQHSLKEEEKEG